MVSGKNRKNFGDQTGSLHTFRRCVVSPPETISVRALLSMIGLFSADGWVRWGKDACFRRLPRTLRQTPRLIMEVSAAKGEEQREKERERWFKYRQEWAPSLPHTRLLISLSHTHTKASSSQLYVIIQSHPTLSHLLNAHKTGCCRVGMYTENVGEHHIHTVWNINPPEAKCVYAVWLLRVCVVIIKIIVVLFGYWFPII